MTMKDLKTQQEKLAPMNAAGAIGAMLELLELHGDAIPALPVDENADLDAYREAVGRLFGRVDMQASYDPDRLPSVGLTRDQRAVLMIESILNSVNAGLVDRDTFTEYLSEIAKGTRDPDHREQSHRAGLLVLATMLITVDSVQERMAEHLARAVLGLEDGMHFETVRAGSLGELMETLRALTEGAPEGTKLN